MTNLLKLLPYRLGFFLNIGFVFSILVSAADISTAQQESSFFASPAALLAVGLSLTSLSLIWLIEAAQRIIGFMLLGFGIFSLALLGNQPLKGYLILCLLFLSAILLRHIRCEYPQDARIFRQRLHLSLIAFASFNWGLVHLFHMTEAPIAHLAVLLSTLLGVGLALVHLPSAARAAPLPYALLGLSCLVWLLAPFASLKPPLVFASQMSLLVLLAGLVLQSQHWPIKQKLLNTIEALFFHPEGAVLVLFLILCSLGTMLLFLPASAASGVSLSFLDAAFTAVSAVCVTGLNVLNFPAEFSLLGQVLVLLLIQLGGLGIMTLSSLAIFLMRHRLSVRQETTLAKLVGHKLKGKVHQALAQILLFTFATEAVGLVLLTLGFMTQGHSFGTALWKGTFTAISAFCNAGFALESSNLMSAQNEPFILYTVSILIILGGLSPAVVIGLPRLRQGPIPLQNRLVLLTTFILLLAGTLIFLGLEWDHSLGSLRPSARFHNAFFQSVTARTAGFNSIDIAAMTPASVLLLIVLMFIGGSPGGTAGGVKTTTIAVAFSLIGNVLRGRNELTLYQRRLSHETVYQALTLLLASLILGLIGTLLLIVTQNAELSTAAFEVFSALGTVGLTRGLTPELNSLGKCLVMFFMFIGRVGPLTVLLFAWEQPPRSRWDYPNEDVVVT